MGDVPSLDRREFTVQSVMALLGGVTITVTACGGSHYSSNPTGSQPPAALPTADLAGSISNNHGHSATITAAQLTAADSIALDIRGRADHPHMVELTAAEVDRIRNNGTVSKPSTMDSSTMAEHQHVVTFSRTAEAPGPGY
jgi:hypothetical protein